MVALKLGQIHHTREKKVSKFLNLVPFLPEKKVNYINFLDCKHYGLTFLIKSDILSDGIFSQTVVIVCKQALTRKKSSKSLILAEIGHKKTSVEQF